MKRYLTSTILTIALFSSTACRVDLDALPLDGAVGGSDSDLATGGTSGETDGLDSENDGGSLGGAASEVDCEGLASLVAQVGACYEEHSEMCQEEQAAACGDLDAAIASYEASCSEPEPAQDECSILRDQLDVISNCYNELLGTELDTQQAEVCGDYDAHAAAYEASCQRDCSEMLDELDAISFCYNELLGTEFSSDQAAFCGDYDEYAAKYVATCSPDVEEEPGSACDEANAALAASNECLAVYQDSFSAEELVDLCGDTAQLVDAALMACEGDPMDSCDELFGKVLEISACLEEFSIDPEASAYCGDLEAALSEYDVACPIYNDWDGNPEPFSQVIDEDGVDPTPVE